MEGDSAPSRCHGSYPKLPGTWIVCEQRRKEGKWGQAWSLLPKKALWVEQAMPQESDFHFPICKAKLCGAHGVGACIQYLNRSGRWRLGKGDLGRKEALDAEASRES